MSARIDRAGGITALDRRAEPDELVSREDAADAHKLSRLLQRILKDVATLKRRYWPRRVDFEDRVVDSSGTTKHRFPHNLNAQVRWWVVDASGAARLARHSDSDLNTLVLTSLVACTVTVRVEAA